MKKSILTSLLATALLLPGIAQTKPVPLFDGKSFKGWEGDLSIFRIEDGAIVGGSLKAAVPRNQFLCTTEEYSDFVLRLKFKLLGDPAKVNAGIQFRTRRIPNNHEVVGYQADAGQNYWGSLYDESRRKKVLTGPKPEDLPQIIKRNDWNEYVIRAEGKQITLELNGHRTVNYTEPDESIEQNGCICLQIHEGPPAEAWYKDIFIATLNSKK